MKNLLRAFTLVAVFVLLSLPAAAQIALTRTWVSGVGDDESPCTRTAPCRTFNAALALTADGGEVNCIDPGTFGGPVNITKSVSIVCEEHIGLVTAVSSFDGVEINVGPGDDV